MIMISNTLALKVRLLKIHNFGFNGRSSECASFRHCCLTSHRCYAQVENGRPSLRGLGRQRLLLLGDSRGGSHIAPLC